MKGWSKSKSGVQSDHTAAVQSPRENNYMKSDTAHLSTAVVPEGQLHYKLISLYVVIFFFSKKANYNSETTPPPLSTNVSN